ncbi:MAG: type IV secretory system conjugative DNA transfer family protein, partial [Pseudomonadota bacterium]
MAARKAEIDGVNRWFLYAAAAGFFASAAWPGPTSPWQSYPLAWALAALGVGGVVRGCMGLRRDYQLRRLRRAAQEASGAHGRARFASLEEREAAGLHDPAGKMLLGEVDTLPAFLPPQLSLAVQAPAGTGKTSALAIGAIFHVAQLGYSVCVSDVKPEMVFLWAKALETRGFRVRFNNPARIGGFTSHDTNPFAPMIEAVNDKTRQGEAFTLAETLARVLIPDTKESKDQ